MVEDVAVGGKIRLEIQFSRMYCQMFSTGFNSGALEGSGTSVMLSGTTSFLDWCQPAWSTRTRACAPGVTACEISFRCKVMPCVVQRGRTKPAPLPAAGQIAPKM